MPQRQISLEREGIGRSWEDSDNPRVPIVHNEDEMIILLIALALPHFNDLTIDPCHSGCGEDEGGDGQEVAGKGGCIP